MIARRRLRLRSARAPQPAASTPPAGGVVLWGCRGALLAATALLAACAATPPAAPEGDAAIAIATVQGSGASSPLAGRTVAVEGVVVASFGGLDGFFLQDPHGDGHADTAEGLFVRWPDADTAPAPGTGVRIEGQVLELGDAGTAAGRDSATLTTLAPARLTLLGAAAVPAPVLLHQPPADWEALEGMRVRIAVPLTVTGNHALLRYGEVLTAFGGRLWQPTELHAPGAAAQALAAANAARALLLDDGRQDRNPHTLWQLPQPLSAAAPLRVGSRIQGVEGVIDQRFGQHRLQPTAAFAAIAQAPRPPPPQVPGALRLAVFNVLNFFNGDGHGGGFPTARGADTPAEFARQRDKLVAALTTLDADILALLEIENDGDGPASSAVALAAALNAAQPGAGYRALPTPAPGGDAIRVALLYRAARVAPVGTTAQLASGPFAYGSRPPLAQAFDLGAGAPLVVAVNHFKSKGGCDQARGADADQGDQQGCWNAARVAAAAALAAWLADDPTGTGSDRVLIVGDLNAYAAEDPIRALHARGYRDVFAGRQEPLYSYVYAGRSGRLDHALASAAAAPLVAGAALWHANADESEAFDYNLEQRRAGDAYRADPWRASDHDPLLLGLRIRPDRLPR